MNKNVWWTLVWSQGLFVVSLPFLIHLSQFLHPIAALVVFNLIFITGAGMMVAYVRKEKHRFSIIWVHLAIIIYGFSLATLLFDRPSGNMNRTINIVPFKTIEMYLSGYVSPIISFYNLVANIGLFIPIGLYIAFCTKRWIIRIFIPILGIMMIEIIQLVTGRGSMDIDDFILNYTGVLLGYLMTPLFRRIVMLKR